MANSGPTAVPTQPQTTPHAPLEQLAEELWGWEHDLFMPGGIHFRGRTTVVRLPDGGLWLLSPNPIDDRRAEELAGLGPVRHLVAPNKLHHVHLGDVAARYPDAVLWAAPGLAAKRADLRFDATLDDVPPDAWAGHIDQVAVRGASWLDEVVFMHRPSGTLLVTDLVFNIYGCRGLLTPLVLRMAGAWRRLAQSRLVRRSVDDRAAFRDSGRRVMALPFDKVVMAHGRPLLENDAEGRSPRAQLETALAWMLAA